MLELKKLSYQISNIKILKDIDVCFLPGSMTAIMGLNGAGKTTLLKILSSYLKPTAGQVLLDKKDIHQYSRQQLARKIAYVPQDFPTEFPFTVFDFVMMGRFAWQKGLFHEARDHDKVNEVIKSLGLEELKTRIVSTLSGGEKQRVLLARAIIQETQIILLDEPVNHLDIKNKIEFLEFLRVLNQKQGKTIIAVMHDFHDANKYFDLALLLKAGRLQFFGDLKVGFESQRLNNVFDIDVKSCLEFKY